MVFREIMKTPEKGIPQDLLAKAHCAIIIPGLKKGGFVVGAKYGKGFITCRRGPDHAGWSAPANVRVEGGSVGFQIGAGEVDLVLLVMNEAGANKLLKSEFKIGGEASAMAGPVGRTVQANTDAYMRAEILGWSRSRGAFAGIALEGSTLREDSDDNRALYGRDITNEQIITGKLTVPPEAATLLRTLGSYSFHEQKK
jgi:lipid-binding SYLF domain-containing protein